MSGAHVAARRPRVIDYVIALLTACVAAAIRAGLAPLFGDRHQLVFFYPAIMISAWSGGVRTGVVTTLFSAALDGYLFLEPVGTLRLVHHGDKVALAVFVMTGVLISILNENLRQKTSREHEARANADAANRTKDFFLAAVSHDLRTPMTAALGWAQMLKDNQLDAARRRRAVEAICRSTNRQLSLVNDLLDAAGILSGHLRIEQKRTDLQSVVRSAAEMAEPLAEAKHIHLDVEGGDGPAAILGDTGRLQQVVGNLLTNAIKFTPWGGAVRVSLRTVDQSAVIQVTDTGKGIAADALPFIFDQFWQAEHSARRDGVGLGLSIANRLVTAHGGTIDAASDGPGKGAIFSVRLPLIRTHEPQGV